MLISAVVGCRALGRDRKKEVPFAILFTRLRKIFWSTWEIILSPIRNICLVICKTIVLVLNKRSKSIHVCP